MSAPKIPLLIRKNIRDEFDGKKEELAQKYKNLFGVDYELTVDFPTLLGQAGTGYGYDSIGSMAYDALSDAQRRFNDMTHEGKDKDLIDGFNATVSKKTITVVADADFKGSYSGCRVKDGVFEIVFKPGGLGTNSFYACDEWAKAIDEASLVSNPKALPPTAKNGIKAEFDDKKAELEEKMSEHLGDQKITCHVDFQDVWVKIVDARDALPKNKQKDFDLDHIARQMGSVVYEYFRSLLGKLEYELKGDEMMIEGFFDEVTSKQAWFGLIPETEKLKGSYTDTLIEDGKLWCKTKPSKYAINVNGGFEGLAALL